MSDAPEKWVPWACVGMFAVGLYGGYTNGGWGGFLSVWLGASGLMMAAVILEGRSGGGDA